MQVYVDIEKLQQDMNKLNVQILYLEQGQVFIKDQLAAIEKNLPDTERKQQEIEVSMYKLFNNSKAFPKKRSRKNEQKEKHKSGVKKARANDSNDQNTDNVDLTRNLESRESDSPVYSPVYYPKENDSSSVTDLEHEDLMLFVGMLEDDLTFSW